MPKQKSLKLNIIMNALLTMSSFIFPLITYPYMTRILLPEGTGKVSFVMSVISYFTMLSRLGIPIYGIHECAKVRDDKEALSRTVQEIFFINLLLTILSYLLILVSVLTIPKFYEEKQLFLVLSMNIILTTAGMEWMFQALEQYTYITVRSLLFKIIGVIAMFLMVKEKSDYVIYGGISIFSSSASYILNFFYVRKFIYWKKLGKYNLKRHMKPVVVFFAMSCATIIYANLGNVILGFMKNADEVGYFDAAIKVKNILTTMIASIGTVLLPRASYYYEQKQIDEFERVSRKALNLVWVMAIPIMLFFIIFAKECILILSGEAYLNAVLPMQAVLPTVLLLGMTSIVGIQVLVPMGLEKYVIGSYVAGTVADAFFSVVLIPSMGATGAAIATSLAELFVLVVQFFVVSKKFKLFSGIQYYKCLIGVLIAYVPIYGINIIAMGNFLKMLLASVVFFVIYAICLLIMKEPIVLEIFDTIVKKVFARAKKDNNV